MDQVFIGKQRACSKQHNLRMAHLKDDNYKGAGVGSTGAGFATGVSGSHAVTTLSLKGQAEGVTPGAGGTEN